ncbi:MAG TPA: hypothetical protein VK021_11715 [Flavobacteriaceae bacterium]|nr:hypothetical protein [Flavobacteriaceae bacterium]
MKYNLQISEEAFFDIEEAVNNYRRIPVENLANKFKIRLAEGMKYITNYPLNLAVKYKGIRIFNLKGFPYQIHYLVIKLQVLVLGVFHEKSNPTSWENRLY